MGQEEKGVTLKWVAAHVTGEIFHTKWWENPVSWEWKISRVPFVFAFSKTRALPCIFYPPLCLAQHQAQQGCWVNSCWTNELMHMSTFTRDCSCCSHSSPLRGGLQRSAFCPTRPFVPEIEGSLWGTDSMPVVHTWDCFSCFQEAVGTHAVIATLWKKKAKVQGGCITFLTLHR